MLLWVLRLEMLLRQLRTLNQLGTLSQTRMPMRTLQVLEASRLECRRLGSYLILVSCSRLGLVLLLILRSKHLSLNLKDKHLKLKLKLKLQELSSSLRVHRHLSKAQVDKADRTPFRLPVNGFLTGS